MNDNTVQSFNFDSFLNSNLFTCMRTHAHIADQQYVEFFFLTRLIIRTSLLFCYFKQMNIHVHNILICSIYAENLYTLLSKMFKGRSKKFKK